MLLKGQLSLVQQSKEKVEKESTKFFREQVEVLTQENHDLRNACHSEAARHQLGPVNETKIIRAYKPPPISQCQPCYPPESEMDACAKAADALQV